jgi:thioesterase domain-containing protein
MAQLHRQALAWSAPTLDVPVRLYRATRHLRGYAAPDTARGWDAHCPQLTMIDVVCDHTQMVLEPFVLEIVEDLQMVLRAPVPKRRGR